VTERNRKTRIWAISRLYLPNFSGAAIQAHQVFRELVRRGFSVTVLTTGDRSDRSLSGRRAEMDGIEIRYLPTLQSEEWASLAGVGIVYKVMPYLKGLLSALLLNLLAAWTLWREGQRGDIVRVYGANHFSFLPIWLARVRGMHSVLHMTLLGADDPPAIKRRPDRLLAFLTLEAFRRADAITGYSSAQIQSCLSDGLDPRKLFQIPGGVDLVGFRPVSEKDRAVIRQRLGLNPDGQYIVFVGDSIARKGLDVLIEAFLRVRSQTSEVELLIVGPYDFSDPYYRLASDLKDKLKVADCLSHVHWVGRVETVYEYMQAADVFCLPSRWEGFGIVIIEAMAVGLPVVVSRLEGVTTDIIKSEREGVLICGYSPEAYAAEVSRLLKDPAAAEAMGNMARSRVVSEFGMDRIVEHYAQLYRQLAGPQSRASEAG
jgi:glycosyltransferase involved in cell wall biosynthesis